MSSKKCPVHLGASADLKRKGMYVGAVFTSLMMGSGPTAFAQEGAALRLEEVTVTARRREESLQDVPIAITAFSGEYLRDHNMVSLDSIQYHTPAMTITYNSGDTLEPRVTVRGIRPDEARLNDDPSVPLYFADVVMTPATGLNVALFDLGSVQVLKGPQGTLFGRNSTAGAVLLGPQLPGDTFGGYIDTTVGNYGLFQTDVGVDVPVTDTFQFRIAGRMLERDGYQTNKNDLPQFGSQNKGRDVYGKELWDDNTKSVRLTARWQPADQLENVTVAEWGDKHARARASKAVLTNLAPMQDSVDRNLALSDPHDVRVNVIAPENVETTFLANTTTWTGELFTVKNILGYRKVKSFRQLDLDGMDMDVIGSRTDGTGDATDAEQFSNEIQLLGTALDDRLDWVVGAYYYDMEGEATQNNGSAGGTAETGVVDSKSYALFAQADYQLTEKLSVTLGARQSWDERAIEISRFTGVIAAPPAGTCALRDADAGCSLSDSDEFSASTWLTTLSYEFTDGVMGYATVGTGYKAGGYNARASTSAQLSPFQEETVTNYELGMKADWTMGDWQFRTSIAAYQMDYSDIQVTVGECVDMGDSVCTVITSKRNAAEATVKGAEIELAIYPTADLSFNFGYAYIDPQYDEWSDRDAAGNPTDRANTIFTLQPDHEANASVRYALPLAPEWGDVSLLLNVSWRSEQILTLDPEVLSNAAWRYATVQDAYYLVDLKADWKGVMGSNFDLSLFVKNLEDETYVTSSSDQMKYGRGLFLSHVYGEPRTYGATLRYTF